MFKKYVLLAAVMITFSLNSEAKNLLRIGLELAPLRGVVGNQPKNSWYKFWVKPEKSALCNGVLLCLAFEKEGLESPVPPSAIDKYSIPEILNRVDVSICHSLVAEKYKCNLDFNNLTDAEFRQLDDLKKRYYDVLLLILQQKYGNAAEPYIAKIAEARKDFEAQNDGFLLKRYVI